MKVFGVMRLVGKSVEMMSSILKKKNETKKGWKQSEIDRTLLLLLYSLIWISVCIFGLSKNDKINTHIAMRTNDHATRKYRIKAVIVNANAYQSSIDLKSVFQTVCQSFHVWITQSHYFNIKTFQIQLSQQQKKHTHNGMWHSYCAQHVFFSHYHGPFRWIVWLCKDCAISRRCRKT